MKELVRHLIANNFDEIRAKSLLNCHCKGLHSIMLLESPGKTIRLYIAVEGNELSRNFPDGRFQSIAFHPHHCNLTLHCVKGQLLNWTLKESDASGMYLTKYKYRSKINEGELSFENSGVSYLKTESLTWLKKGESVHMPANQIHTVACNDNEISAWLVYEGVEDPHYESFCWSNSNPNQLDATGLYRQPTEQQILKLLSDCDLL